MTGTQPPAIQYTNPVYPHSAPDPFVLKYCGEYWCYSSGLKADGSAFGILHSPDLVHWKPAGSALTQLPGRDPYYWAPEVAYLEGTFYMYYSVGDEEHMHLRVATAAHPGGPFTDNGLRLTDEKFAIDPHVFVDGDGSRYLFYAVDFVEHSRIGTGTVVDRLLDPFHLEGRPRPVTRAKYDWQIFDRQRASKGGVCWHTIEGSFVLKHGGRYYQMFSGGNWQNKTYGVSYAVADHLDREDEWDQHCDGEEVLPVLRTIPELGVIGPGHNSVVRSPDNRRLYCIYHRWLPEIHERVLAIDPLEWEGEQLVVRGPSVTPQEINLPVVNGFDTVSGVQGSSGVETGVLTLAPVSEHEAAAEIPLPGPGFTLEISLCSPEPDGGQWGLELYGKNQAPIFFTFQRENTATAFSIRTQDRERAQDLELAHCVLDGFLPQAYHLLRIERENDQLRVSIDDDLLQDSARLRWSAEITKKFERARLFARGAAAKFAGLQIAV